MLYAGGAFAGRPRQIHCSRGRVLHPVNQTSRHFLAAPHPVSWAAPSTLLVEQAYAALAHRACRGLLCHSMSFCVAVCATNPTTAQSTAARRKVERPATSLR